MTCFMMIAELEDQQGKIRELNEEMEAYKAQQEELDEQRRRADELQRQYEESKHASEEEKALMVRTRHKILLRDQGQSAETLYMKHCMDIRTN